MLAGELEIRMFAEIARLRKDMNEALGVVTRTSKGIEGAAAAATKALGFLGIGISAVGFIRMIKGSIDAMDNLNDLSKSTSITVEELSGLSLAAKQSGGDLDSIAASINKLSLNMGKDADKFRALGVTAKEPLEAFKQLSDVFVAIKDPQQRAAVMAEALGKSWAGAAPLLAEGSEKIQEMVTNGTELSGVTSDMVKQADDLNDKWAELVGTGGTLNRIIGPTLPLLNMLASEMVEAKKSAQGMHDEGMNPLLIVLQTFLVVGAYTRGVLVDIGTAAGGTAARLAALARLDFTAFKNIGIEMKTDLEKSAADVEAFVTRVMNARALTAQEQPHTAGLIGGTVGRTPGIAGFLDGGKAAKDAAEERAKLMKMDAKNNELSWEARVTAAQEYNDMLGGLDVDAYRERMRIYAQQEKDNQESMRIFYEERQAIVDASEEGKLEATRRRVAQEEKILETFHRQDQQRLDAATRRTTDAARDLGMTFSSAFEDMLIKGAKARDMMQGLAQDVARMIARKTISEPLAAGVTSVLGKMFGGGFDYAAAGSSAQAGYQADMGFATGTNYVPRTGLALVHQGEKIIPASENRGGGGDTYIIDARGADNAGLIRVEAMIRQLNGSIERRATAAAVDATRRGGSASRYMGAR